MSQSAQRESRVSGTRHDAPSETATYVVLAVLVTILLGATVIISGTPEVQIGLVIVIALATLMVLLYVVANGFYHLDLTNDREALGLPSGSIRALIALFLVLLFTIMGIYLFRSVGLPGSYELKGLSAEQVIGLGDRVVVATRLVAQGSADTYDVRVRGAVMPEDGVRLAQQLLTTIGTLVVAVAGFYFGSAKVAAASKAVRGEAELAITTRPRLKDGQVEVQYDVPVAASAGEEPYHWSILGDSVPGLSIDEHTGKISGKPTTAGEYHPVIQVEDDTKATAFKRFDLTVKEKKP